MTEHIHVPKRPCLIWSNSKFEAQMPSQIAALSTDIFACMRMLLYAYMLEHAQKPIFK